MAKFTETVLSSAQLALVGGQISREDVLAGARSLADLPLRAVEIMCPGLARVLVERLAENPFERIRLLRKIMPKATLLISLDVRCGFGDEIIGDQAVKRLIQIAAEAGVDRFRLLEPTRNADLLAPAITHVRELGKNAEVLFTLDNELAAKPDAVVEWAGRVAPKGQFEIVLHSENGVLAPKQAATLVKALKAGGYTVGLSLSTCAGLAGMSAYAAADAGVDSLDTALSPFAGGTSFPPTESMALALPDAGLTLDSLKESVKVFGNTRNSLIGVIARNHERMDGQCLYAKSAAATVPKAAAKSLGDVEKELGSASKAPEDALLVVMFGKAGLSLVKGESKAQPLQPAGVRAYDVEVDGGRYHVEVHPSAVGMVVTPSPKAAPAPKPAPRPAPGGARPAPAGAQAGPSRPAPAPAAASAAPTAPAVAKPQGSAPRDPELAAKGGGKPVNVPCPMQGTIVKALVKVGDRVERMSKLIVLEAMKMENDVISPVAGIVKQILVQPGEAVQAGQMLVVIEP